MNRSPRLAVLAAGVLALTTALAGCGSGDDDAASGGTQKLTLWTFKQSQVEALTKLGADWGTSKGFTVEVKAFTPDDAYATKVRASAKTKDLPDILMVHSAGEEWTFAQAGILSDLTPDFDEAWRSQLQPSALTSATLSQKVIDGSAADPSKALTDLKAGNWYGVPVVTGSAGVVFARKSVLQKAGVDTTNPPKTWQEWVAAMTKTKQADPAGGLVTGLQVAPTGYFWLYRPMAYAYLGKDAFYGRQGRDPQVGWDSAKSVETLDLYNQLTPVWANGVLALGIDQADLAFAQGKAAWDVGGSFTLPFLTQQGLDPADLMVFTVPAPSGGALSGVTLKPSSLISAGVTSSSAHRTEAVDFLRYLGSTKGGQDYLATANDLPATQLSADSVSDPLQKQLLAAFDGPESQVFEVNDFSADPGAGSLPITTQTADVLNKIVARKASPQDIGGELAKSYSDAWKQAK